MSKSREYRGVGIRYIVTRYMGGGGGGYPVVSGLGWGWGGRGHPRAQVIGGISCNVLVLGIYKYDRLVIGSNY